MSEANRLKVLMIGNSFADDKINYAYEIAKNSGIPEENKNTVSTNCHNHGNITGSGNDIGGITGEIYPKASLTDCSNDGVITANGVVATEDYGSANSYVGLLVSHPY